MRVPPSGRVPEQGPDWVLVATEACGGGTPDLFCAPIVLGYMDIYRRKKYVRGATKGPRGWRVRPGGWARPPASCLPRFFPDVHSKSIGLLSFQNNFSRRFHSVSTPFDIPSLRNTETREKQELALGSRLIG